MSDGTKIEWTDATWTPVKGCTRVSPGCGGPGPHGGCYAEIMAARFSKPGQWGEGLAKIVTLPDGSKDHRWTGVIRFDEHELLKPLSWKKPRRIFVCSTADLFHDGVTDEQIDKVFAVMALCPQHTFQVLTKRPERMRAYFAATPQPRWMRWMDDMAWEFPRPEIVHPVSRGILLQTKNRALENVWLGTSVEDQQRANERVPHLLATPAAVRFLSCEPLLGPVDLTWIEFANERRGMECYDALSLHLDPGESFPAGTCDGVVDWVIVGGESGPGARPMHPDWARSLRDQCATAGVPFFFKQWGDWGVSIDRERDDPDWRADYSRDLVDGGKTKWLNLAGGCGFHGERFHVMRRVGKKAAGRLLDGVEHNGMPTDRRAA